MHKFVRNLLTEWRKLNLPFGGETFIVAVSGGADSISLLLALDDLRERKKLKNRFVIAHFNHNLRGAESDKDADFVRDLTGKYNFELACKTQDSNLPLNKQIGNLEQNARNARYNFLREIAENLHADGILTAHTADDQAETFLINLLRGSGLHGLSGMKPLRLLIEEKRMINSFENEESEIFGLKFDAAEIRNPKSEIRLIRPLLNWARRNDTENFCREREIEPRYDAMNEDLTFQRVRIRKVLLPMLADFNPKIVETLARTASLLRSESENPDDAKQKNDANEKHFAAPEILLKELKTLSKSSLYRVLRQWLRENRGDLRGIESKHVEAVGRLAFSQKSGRIAELPNGEIVVRENGKLVFKNFQVEK